MLMLSNANAKLAMLTILLCVTMTLATNFGKDGGERAEQGDQNWFLGLPVWILWV